MFSKNNVPPGFYVYLYLREDGTPYYVGKGIGKRAWSKARAVRSPRDQSRIVIVEWNLLELGALWLERKLIHWYRRKDVDYSKEIDPSPPGILRNKTDGGDGTNRAKRKVWVNSKFVGANKWYNSLTQDEKQKVQDQRHHNACKGWYVSKIDDPTEVYIHSIAKWCKLNGVDVSAPSKLTTPGNQSYQKQTKGWRIRRSDQPPLPAYTDKRKIGHENVACKGKTWRLENGTRVWHDK